MEGSGLLIDLREGSGGKGTKGTTAGGKDIRRAEEAGQQDMGCRLRKKTCVRHCLSVKAYMTFYNPSAQTLLNPH